MVNELMALETREAAQQLLAVLNKKDVLRLANELDVYIKRGDGRERIIEKIIEFSVGYKIRSRAIANTRTK